METENNGNYRFQPINIIDLLDKLSNLTTIQFQCKISVLEPRVPQFLEYTHIMQCGTAFSFFWTCPRYPEHV